MGLIDSLITIGIIVTFFAFVGSKIYSHEKEHLDPLINKVKGWFSPKEDDELSGEEDFEIGFRGQID